MTASTSAAERIPTEFRYWENLPTPRAQRLRRILEGRRGRHTALRVRLMHVFVRRRLLAHPRWDLSA
jgi:hypothetical protein